MLIVALAQCCQPATSSKLHQYLCPYWSPQLMGCQLKLLFLAINCLYIFCRKDINQTGAIFQISLFSFVRDIWDLSSLTCSILQSDTFLSPSFVWFDLYLFSRISISKKVLKSWKYELGAGVKPISKGDRQILNKSLFFRVHFTEREWRSSCRKMGTIKVLGPDRHIQQSFIRMATLGVVVLGCSEHFLKCIPDPGFLFVLVKLGPHTGECFIRQAGPSVVVSLCHLQ